MKEIPPTHQIKFVFLLQILIRSKLTWLINSWFLYLKHLHEFKLRLIHLGFIRLGNQISLQIRHNFIIFIHSPNKLKLIIVLVIVFFSLCGTILYLSLYYLITILCTCKQIASSSMLRQQMSMSRPHGLWILTVVLHHLHVATLNAHVTT